MLTPQEVAERSFSKATLGGYNMAMVDEFLDELTEDYSSLYKENAVLKQKLKVLVEKVEEYRATEDSMRATLLAAQRMADDIVAEAEAKKKEILSQAETNAAGQIGDIQTQIDDANARLLLAKTELNDFVTSAKETCAKQLAFLNELPEIELPAPPAAPAAEEKAAAAEEEKLDDAVEDIENSIFAAFDANLEEDEEDEEEDDVNPFAGDDPLLSQTRPLNLKDLKFGRNYTGEDD